jgi:hypothetical protein
VAIQTKKDSYRRTTAPKTHTLLLLVVVVEGGDVGKGRQNIESTRQYCVFVDFHVHIYLYITGMTYAALYV